MRLKAGALYYTILICLVIGVILNMLILNFSLSKYSFDSILKIDFQKQELFNYLTNKLQTPNEVLVNKTPNSSKDSILFSSIPWGFYAVTSAMYNTKPHPIKKMALVGQSRFSDSTALFIADSKSPLSISGNTKITGNCYLPGKKYEQIAFQGNYYREKRPITGKINSSNNQLPEPGAYQIDRIKNIYNKQHAANDSVVLFSKLNSSELRNSFFNKTLIFYSEQDIYIDNIELSGNIIIQSDLDIFVSSTAKLDNIQLLGKRIIFKSGFRGTVQAIAQDSLVVNELCTFLFPSVIGICNFSSNTVHCSVNANTTVAGGLILYQPSKPLVHSKLKLDLNSTLLGQVYCDATFEFDGEVMGSIYAQRILLKDKNKSSHINHLHNKIINPFLLSDKYVNYVIFKDIKALDIIEWLD